MDDFSGIWEGLTAIGDDPKIVVMWAIAGFLMYFGIARKKEPLLVASCSTQQRWA